MPTSFCGVTLVDTLIARDRDEEMLPLLERAPSLTKDDFRFAAALNLELEAASLVDFSLPAFVADAVLRLRRVFPPAMVVIKEGNIGELRDHERCCSVMQRRRCIFLTE